MDSSITPNARRQELSPYRIRQLVKAGAMVRITRGAYASPLDADALRRRAETLLAVLPSRAVVCRRTAAWLWGLDVLPPGQTEAKWPVEIVVPAGTSPPRRPGCRSYQADLPPEDVTEVAGVRVTSKERTALDCARFAQRMEAVAAVDQFLRCGVDLAALRDRAATLAGQRNTARLRDVIDTADPGAASPGESWTRTLVVDAGLPRPRTQVPVRLPADRHAFLDMALAEYGTGIEYDGAQHHSRREDMRHDEERRRLIAASGWQVVVAREEHVLGNPRPFLYAVTETLLARGWNPSPARLSDIMKRIAALSRRRSPPWS